MTQITETIPLLMWSLSKSWENLSHDSNAISLLEKSVLPAYLRSCRWFAGKARRISAVCVDEMLSLTSGADEGTTEAAEIFHLLILKIKYRAGKLEHYLLPLSIIPANQSQQVNPKGIIASVKVNESDQVLIDAIYDESFRRSLFRNLFYSSKIRQPKGSLFFVKGKAFKEEGYRGDVSSSVPDVEQSNSSLIFDEKYFFKIYRKLFHETNPDVEVVSFLTEKAGFTHIPAFAGSLSWKKPYHAPVTLGMMQEKVESIKSAWSLVGDYLNEYLHGVMNGDFTINHLVLNQVALLATRTAEMHLALGSDANDPSFAPEPFNDEYRDWLSLHFESLVKRRIQLAKENQSPLDEKGRTLLDFFLQNTGLIRSFFANVNSRNIQSLRIRIHGDYHLGQVLFNGSDYIILDFEGEPESSITDRKIKHSPLKDVAGMLRSFHYAVSAKLYFSENTKEISGEVIENAAQHWYKTISASFLQQYFETFGENAIVGMDKSERAFLLQLHLLEKAIYELGYELNGRPAWVKIPLKGIEQVVKEISLA